MKYAAAVLGLAAVAAGCTAVTREAKRERPPAEQRAQAQAPRHPLRKLVHITVVDGDTLRAVRGAVVRIGRHTGRADRRGVAAIRIGRPASLPVYVSARGYTRSTFRIQFRLRSRTHVRVYRPALQWPMYGAGPARTQTQTRIHLRPPFRTVWSRGIGSLMEFPAVVFDGIAYVGSHYGIVRAISMRSGTVVWRHDTPNGEMAASPTVAGDELVVHGMDGHVWVLDRRNGRLRWRYTIGSPIESSPLVRDDVDYFGAWNGNVYALDLRRHRLRWARSLGYKITASASFAGGRLYIGDYGGRLFALSPRTGKALWTGGVNGRIYGTPAVASGRVFVPSSDGDSLTAFSTSGSRLWTIYTGSYVYSSPAVWGGRVFFGSYNGLLYCVSAGSGRILWTVGVGGAVSGAAVVVDGIVYAGSFGHQIVGVDARSGRVVFHFRHGHYVPVSGNGGRLLLHGYSRLYAVAPRR